MSAHDQIEISENALRPQNGELLQAIEQLNKDQNLSISTPECIIQLEQVPNSTQAVYQTLKLSESDDIKQEVAELQELLQKNNSTILGPDGKVLSPSNYKAADENLIKNIKSQMKSSQFQCEKCKHYFVF